MYLMNAKSADFIEGVRFTSQASEVLPEISFLHFNGEQFTLNHLYQIKFVDQKKAEDISILYQRSECIVCEIIEKKNIFEEELSVISEISETMEAKDSQIVANLTCFAFKSEIIYEPFYISVDDKIVESLKNNRKKIDDLKEIFGTKIDDKIYYLVDMGGKQDELFGELPKLKAIKAKCKILT